jgi:hypothetical protein
VRVGRVVGDAEHAVRVPVHLARAETGVNAIVLTFGGNFRFFLAIFLATLGYFDIFLTLF